jgi:hypothetical protein
VIKKEGENILKYKDLIIEVLGMWNVTAEVILVIIMVTGTISKSLSQYLSRKVQNYGTTKNSHIAHCTHTTESANVEVQNISPVQ